jgi:hypothetical protein
MFLIGSFCSLFLDVFLVFWGLGFVGFIGFLQISFGCSCVYFLCTYGGLTLHL